MSDDEKSKKIESLEKMFGTKDELKISGEKKIIKKEPVIAETPNKEIELQEGLFPDLEEKPKPKKVKEELDEPKVQQNTQPSKNFPLEKIKENLKPEIKEIIKKLEATVPKESVDKLINVMEKNKNVIFDSNVTNVFNGLSAGEASLMTKKLSEWEVPKEASEINASVIVAWLNKTKK